MKNLREFGVQELRTNEENEINGGGLVGLFIAGVLTGYKLEAMANGNKWYELPF